MTKASISQRPTLKMEGTLATDGRSLREANTRGHEASFVRGGFRAARV